MPTYNLSLTLSKLLQIMGQICAFDRGYLSLTHSFGVNHLNSRPQNLALKKLEKSPYRVLQMRFNTVRRGLSVTDRRTDRTAVINSAVYRPALIKLCIARGVDKDDSVLLSHISNEHREFYGMSRTNYTKRYVDKSQLHRISLSNEGQTKHYKRTASTFCRSSSLPPVFLS